MTQTPKRVLFEDRLADAGSTVGLGIMFLLAIVLFPVYLPLYLVGRIAKLVAFKVGP